MDNKLLEISKKIDKEVSNVLLSKAEGFEKAFVMSLAIDTLRQQLTPQYMGPIMKLQGSSLGFKTDKDIDLKTKKKGTGYSEDIVKDCLIDAVFLGLQPTGNEFNIIGGNMYPTREGFSALLDNIDGLKKNFSYTEIRQPNNSKVANVVVKVQWGLFDEPIKKQTIDFPIKSTPYTSYDALIGKAERKAKRWLFNTIKGTNISDGDVTDIPHQEVQSNVNHKKQYLQELFDNNKSSIKAEDALFVERVLEIEEIASYDKCINALKKYE
jgi:hypothetical protein